MKKLLLPSFLLSFFCSYAQWDQMNINYLGHFDDPAVTAEPVYGIRYQACWGWVNPADNREYGILGSTAGTYIIDVTDPANPVQSDYVAGRLTDCIWHEYKTYGNALYIISDDGGPNSFQIADLSYLPDSVHVVYDSTDIFVQAHTLFIDGNKLYVGSVSTGFGFSSMNVYSLNDPFHPTLLRRLDQDYPFISHVHDMFVSNDTVYANCGYDGLFIFHYDSLANQFVQLGALPGSGYNHSSFLSPDHSILYVCEEVPDGQPVQIVNVSDINNPTVVDTFYSNIGATPHNPYVEGNYLIIAYYQDGVYIYDISNPAAPVFSGYFDTFMTNPPGSYLQPAYAGCWSVYTELPSGVLLAGDMQSGLFCLDISDITSGIDNPVNTSIRVFPNPTMNLFRVQGANNSQLELFDMHGKLLFSQSIDLNEIGLDISGYSSGIYNLRISGNGKVLNRKIVKY